MFAGSVGAFSDRGSAWNGCGVEETNGTTRWLSVSTTCDPRSGGRRGVAAAAGGFAGFGCSLLFLLLFELATFRRFVPLLFAVGVLLVAAVLPRVALLGVGEESGRGASGRCDPVMLLGDDRE